MSKFAIIKLELVDIKREKIPFYKLVINGRCPYDKFDKKTFNSNLKSQNLQINVRLVTIAEGNQHILPSQKFHQLKRDKSDKLIDYEIKTKNLRLYFFKDENSRIIVLGGLKGNQDKDLEKFRRIKKEYFKNKS